MDSQTSLRPFSDSSTHSGETTAQDDEGEPSTEERQSRQTEVELEKCLAAMGEPSPPPTSTTPASQPPVVKPVPKAPAATEIQGQGQLIEGLYCSYVIVFFAYFFVNFR